jgi:hypothetical protein
MDRMRNEVVISSYLRVWSSFFLHGTHRNDIKETSVRIASHWIDMWTLRTSNATHWTPMFSVILFNFYSQYVGSCKGHDTQVVCPEMSKISTADTTRQNIHNLIMKSQISAQKCLDASTALVLSSLSFSQTDLLSNPGIEGSNLHLLIQCIEFFLPSSLLRST